MKVLVGKLEKAYANADTDKPPAGAVFEDEVNQKTYRFMQNEGATTITAKMAAVLSDADSNQVQVTNTLADPRPVAVRPAGAEDLAQNEWGYFQTHGNTTCIFGASALATVVGDGVVIDDDADKGKIGGQVVDVTSTVNETTVEAVTNSARGVFGIAQAVVSSTDADVEVQLLGRGW